MSDAQIIAASGAEHVNEMITEMFAGDHDNDHMLLGTLQSGSEQVQVQLIVTRNTEEFLDEQ